MKKPEPSLQNQGAPAGKAWLGAGLLAAFAASLCCITPVLALLGGVSGIAATFSWLEPFRPYLIGATILVLGFAWYQKLKPRALEEINCACEDDNEGHKKPSFLQSRKFLAIVTVSASLLLAFPYYSGLFFPDNDTAHASVVNHSDVVEASLFIKGMTCEGCEKSVNYALTNQEGVVEAVSSYKDGSAKVKFDRTRVTVEELAQAIEEETGYTVTNKGL